MDSEKIIGLITEATIDIECAEMLYSIKNTQRRSLFFAQQAYEKVLKAYLLSLIFPRVWRINPDLLKLKDQKIIQLLKEAQEFKNLAKIGHNFKGVLKWCSNFFDLISLKYDKQESNILMQEIFGLEKIFEVDSALDKKESIRFILKNFYTQMLIPAIFLGSIEKLNKINEKSLLKDLVPLNKEREFYNKFMTSEISNRITSEVLDKHKEVSELYTPTEITAFLSRMVKQFENFEIVLFVPRYFSEMEYETSSRYGLAEGKFLKPEDLEFLPNVLETLKGIIMDFLEEYMPK